MTQAGVFFAVSWFIAALIGGLHYWLIRRDMRGDPATGGSNAIRSFYLNVIELIAAPVAINTGASIFGQIGQHFDVTYGLAVTLAALALVGVLEWERRRACAGTAVGLFFRVRRSHHSGLSGAERAHHSGGGVMGGAFLGGVWICRAQSCRLALAVSIQTWAGPLASLITGISYIAFDVHLSRRWKQDVPGAREARRGFVFALLCTGMLSTAIGGALALYAVISNALGSPLANWQHLAHAGAATVVAGLLILVVYLVLANRQKLLARTSKSATQVEPSAASAPITVAALEAPTIEGVLDALIAGRLSRDEAAAPLAFVR